MSKERSTEAKNFAKEHWPKIAAVTVAGSAIVLLIQYYRKKRKSDSDDEKQLSVLENEAITDSDSVAIILETGSEVMRIIPSSDETLDDLAEGVNDPQAQEVMGTLSSIEKNSKK